MTARSNTKIIVFLAVLVVAAAALPANGGTIYVDSLAAGAGTGATWTDAFTDLQDALELSELCSPAEIWVATGIYTPGENA